MKSTIGKILHEELKKAGRPSLQDFASALNISYRTLYNVMQGKSTLTFEQVMRAGEILTIDVVSMYTGNESNKKGVKTAAETKSMTISLNITGPESAVISNISELLKEFREKAKPLGLTVG